ncbi:citrulline utilization hydrolase CtlX [Roseateles toxinivorans]|nr:arginine deiminase-related protein [Roseateles toxinivorans]
MVRPHHFHPNPQTAADNSFQSAATDQDAELLAARARDEVTAAAAALEAAGVIVHLFDDFSQRETPDSVFPNNWFSTHVGGHVAIYPMYSPNRRRERRADVLELLKTHYRVQDVIDYSGLEHDGLFLEGTGAMVLDHVDRVAYTAQSNRANAVALERFCTHFNYEPMVFASSDAAGRAVYHTNVIMCIAGEFALVALEMIPDAKRREEIAARLCQSGREVIALTEGQIQEFAGNALELMGRDGLVLALSSRACAALSSEQRARIERSARLLPLSVPTIELAGGSVRCMLAGIHLTPR